MLRIPIDFGRPRNYKKREAGAIQVDFGEALVMTSEPGAKLVALDDALNRLALVDARKSGVVELRFFGRFDLKKQPRF
jgi:RNA polymerase sigma-70 factor, ECF subfamily